MSPAFVSVFLACLLSQWKRFSASVTNESIDFCCRSHPLVPSHLPGFCDFSCPLSLLPAPLPSQAKLFSGNVYFLHVLIFHPNIDPLLIWFPPHHSLLNSEHLIWFTAPACLWHSCVCYLLLYSYPIEWLKIMNLLPQAVSKDQESRSGLAGEFWLRASHEVGAAVT